MANVRKGWRAKDVDGFTKVRNDVYLATDEDLQAARILIAAEKISRQITTVEVSGKERKVIGPFKDDELKEAKAIAEMISSKAEDIRYR